MARAPLSGGDAVASKWNARYACSGDAVPPPAEVLSRHERFLPIVPGASSPDVPVPRALDLACGRAANAERLAALGLEAHAWDVSSVAIEALAARSGSRIAGVAVRDVVAEPPAPDSFDAIVVARFLERSICPAIAAALRPGGTLFYQTFTHGLSNPDYLLGPNELPELFGPLDVLVYREPPPGPDGRAEAMLVARRVPPCVR